MKRSELPRVALLAAVALAWIIPILWMADTAFKPPGEIFSSPPRWIPSRVDFGHMRKLFAEWPFLRWTWRSLVVAVVTAGGSLVLSILAAYSFARLHWKGRDTVFVVGLVFMLLPFEVNVIPLFFTMSRFRLLNTVLGVALPVIATPVGVFLLRQFFINIPQDMEDVARIEGCSNAGILWNVIVPISRPVIGAFGVYIFNLSWNEFFWPMICLQRSHLLTLPVGLRQIQGAEDIDYGLFMAAAFAATIPTLAVFIALRRQIIRGFTLAGSGVKG